MHAPHRTSQSTEGKTTPPCALKTIPQEAIRIHYADSCVETTSTVIVIHPLVLIIHFSSLLITACAGAFGMYLGCLKAYIMATTCQTLLEF